MTVIYNRIIIIKLTIVFIEYVINNRTPQSDKVNYVEPKLFIRSIKASPKNYKVNYVEPKNIYTVN